MTTYPGRRGFLAAAGALALTGCGNSPVFRSISTFTEQRFGGDSFTREQVERLPYATLAAGIGSMPRAMLVLGRVEGDDFHWIAADRGVLVTRHGRLVKTVGLTAGNLADTVMLDPDPLTPGGDWKRRTRWRRLVDFAPSREMGVVVSSEWVPEETETIPTFRGNSLVIRIRETNTVPSRPEWRMENRFWLDPETGATIASNQTIVPGAQQIRLEFLKAYRAE